MLRNCLTHCGLVTEYGDIDWVTVGSGYGSFPDGTQSQYLDQCWLIVKCVYGIYPRAISQEVPTTSILNMCLDIAPLNYYYSPWGHWVKQRVWLSPHLIWDCLKYHKNNNDHQTEETEELIKMVIILFHSLCLVFISLCVFNKYYEHAVWFHLMVYSWYILHFLCQDHIKVFR